MGADSLSVAELRRRNFRIDAIGAASALPALLAPFVLYANGVPTHNDWPLGLGLGLAVILPATYVAAATLPHGTERLREFLRYYEQRYAIGPIGLTLLCAPLAILGLVSAVELAL